LLCFVCQLLDVLCISSSLGSSIPLIVSVLGRVLVRRADAHAATALGAARLVCMGDGRTEG
jgi:hypothetical protein